MRAISVYIAFMLAVPSAGLAWSAAAHKIIASIAFRQLSRDEQVRVVAILKQHPRFDEHSVRCRARFRQRPRKSKTNGSSSKHRSGQTSFVRQDNPHERPATTSMIRVFFETKA